MKIHLIGVKGSGMSSLAQFLKDMGHDVDGSDKGVYIFTQDILKKAGINIINFDEIKYNDYDIFIAGHDFINSDYVFKALESEKIVYEYNEYLAKLNEQFVTIAVSGTHGKTTTTKIIADIMNTTLKTSYVIGDGEGKYINASNYLVYEACEYKRHFLSYFADTHVILNVEFDHVDYFVDEEDYNDAFFEFASNAKYNLVINGDEKFYQKVKDIRKNIITFGLEDCNKFQAKNIVDDEQGLKYDLYINSKFKGVVKIRRNGLFMVYNTLAALATASIYISDIDVLIKAISNFSGVNRRWVETLIDDEVYIDDYAHHPSEIKAVLNALRTKYKKRKIIAVFRPDRHSRILKFKDEFIEALTNADQAYVVNFPPTSKNDTHIDFDARILCDGNKIKFFDETNESYQEIASFNHVVYVFMSSKDLSFIANKIKSKRME